MGQQLPEGTRCANSEARGYWHGEQVGGTPSERPKAELSAIASFEPADGATDLTVQIIVGHPGSPWMPRPGPNSAILGVGVMSDGLE